MISEGIYVLNFKNWATTNFKLGHRVERRTVQPFYYNQIRIQ
jgi:coproporphyrinogen III oxidase